MRVKTFTNSYVPSFRPKFDSATRTTEEITIPPTARQVETRVSVQGTGGTDTVVIIVPLETGVLLPLPPEIPKRSVTMAPDISVEHLKPTTPGDEYSITFTLPRATAEGKVINVLHHTGAASRRGAGTRLIGQAMPGHTPYT